MKTTKKQKTQRNNNKIKLGIIPHYGGTIDGLKIDKIYESAISNGAIGGKITGAGAGGHILLYCEKNKQKLLKEKMKNIGLDFVKFNFHKNSPKVLNLYDYS